MAVSGGVDSMVLLDILRNRPEIRLTVAHFDHGMRDDSHLDKQFVEKVAKTHKLPFVHAKGSLGSVASEAIARAARYNFLESVRKACGAGGIITAHHQDDVLETAILNILRGTGRRGLTSLKSTDNIVRPLLPHAKEQLKDYANSHKIAWREDSTNKDMRYRRNYVRHKIMNVLTPGQRAQLQFLLEDVAQTNEQLDTEITNMLHTQPAIDKIERNWFIALPYEISGEVLHHFLDRRNIPNLNRRRIEQLVTVLKTGQPNTIHDVSKSHKIHLSKKIAHLKTSK